MLKSAEHKAAQAIQDYTKDDVSLDLVNKDLTPTEATLLQIADILALLTEILEWKFEDMQYDWFNYVWANSINRLKKHLVNEFDYLNRLADQLEQLFKSGIKPTNPFLTIPQHQTFKK